MPSGYTPETVVSGTVWGRFTRSKIRNLRRQSGFDWSTSVLELCLLPEGDKLAVCQGEMMQDGWEVAPLNK